MISIILMEPEEEGNIGAIARAMANFGFNSLFLVNPKADHLSGTAIARSKHAKDILKGAEIITVDGLKVFDILIATTSKLGSDYNLPRSPLMPGEISSRIADIEGNVGILFGREGNGLTNEEILLCDFLLTIPSSKEYPALNLSHSVAIICYELYKSKGESDIRSKFRPLPEKEREVILQKINSILDNLSFSTDDKKETQRRFWKRYLGKGMITRREGYILLGFIKKINEKIGVGNAPHSPKISRK